MTPATRPVTPVSTAGARPARARGRQREHGRLAGRRVDPGEAGGRSGRAGTAGPATGVDRPRPVADARAARSATRAGARGPAADDGGRGPRGLRPRIGAGRPSSHASAGRVTCSR